MAHVVGGSGTIKGAPFTYGDYDVTLIDCKVCGGVYAVGAEQEHGATTSHKAAALAQSA